MSLPVLIQPRAEADIRGIAAWWSKNRSPEQAARWWDGILEAIESLGEAPERCALARENPKHPCELRSLNFGLGSSPTHRILFTIRPEAVHVLTIRHTAQDDWDPDEV